MNLFLGNVWRNPASKMQNRTKTAKIHIVDECSDSIARNRQTC